MIDRRPIGLWIDGETVNSPSTCVSQANRDVLP